MKEILSKINKLVTPSKSAEKHKSNIANEILKRVFEEIDGRLEIKGAEFGGSYPKGTWLPQSADIDIFVKFDPKVSEKKFSSIIIDVGKKALAGYKPYLRYSDHPYVEAVVKDTKVNIVPCYAVKLKAWQSAADRSPFHTEFMKKNLTASMKSDVRIFKWFFSYINYNTRKLFLGNFGIKFYKYVNICTLRQPRAFGIRATKLCTFDLQTSINFFKDTF